MNFEAVAGKRCNGYFHERFAHGGEAVEAHAQSPEILPPCECMLEDPPDLALATAVRLTPTGDLRSDAGSVQ